MSTKAEQPRGSEFQETTIQSLRHIIESTRPRFSPLPGGMPTLLALDRTLLGIDCDEVHPSICVGNIGAAKSLMYLHHLGVTHVLNVAEDFNPGIMSVSAQFYRCTRICYMGIPLQDHPSCNISSYFFITANFIDQCIVNGGKILICCQRGVSRSGTIALSYMMIKLGIHATVACRMVCQKRKIIPNSGFLQQLCSLDNLLRLKRNS